jgi:FkbM family methyltransferase
VLTAISQYIYNAYLQSLRSGASARRRQRKWRRFRRWMLKLTDPEIIVRLDSFQFKTLFSSNILLSHFELPFYDTALPRLAKAVKAAQGRLVIVDIGANVGAASYLASAQTPGQFFCVEANPRFKSSLSHNLAQIPGSTARFVALTDQSRTERVHHNYSDGNSNIEADEAGEPIQFTTLDELLSSESVYGAPNLIKIDTEGFELKILRGAKRILARHQPVLFLEFFPELIRQQGDTPDALFEFLAAHGYEQCLFYNGAGHLLTRAASSDLDEIRALRRYCELGQSFFDVAVFSKAARDLPAQFFASETQFFERSLGRG